MSIGVICNLSDGVILGADSAITVFGSPAQGGQPIAVKVYYDARKVFQLAESVNIGILTYGTSIIGARTIESYIREFEQKHKSKIEDLKSGNLAMSDLCNLLFDFFKEEYQKAFGMPGEMNQVTHIIGLAVAGFSENQPLAEVYQMQIPTKSPECIRERGNFGTNWFGEFGAITRFFKGFDVRLIDSLIKYFVQNCGVKWDKEHEQAIQRMIAEFEYRVPYQAMPLQQGVEHVQFLLDVVINQHKFVVGAPLCGGNIRIAVVQPNSFQFVTDDSFKMVRS